MKTHNSLAYCSVLLVCLMGCRTATPKGSQEVLSGQDVKDQKNNLNEVMTNDANASSDASTMWSPASRRANAMFKFLVAQKAIVKGDNKLAEENLESSYNLDPNAYIGAQLVKSKLIADANDPDALTEARRMSLLYPNDAQMRLLFGHALFYHNELREAELQLRKAIDLDSKQPDAYAILIKLYQFQKQNDQAIATAKKFTASLPSLAMSWTTLSRLLISVKKFNEALEPSKKAWELQESNLEHALIYALVLDLNQRSKEAIKLYEQLYRFNPGSNELVQRMIALYKEIGNLNHALTLLDDMIENSKDEVPGLKMQKILILWEMDRNDEALKIARELEAELPESDRVFFMSGIAHHKVGQKVEAVAKFERIQSESHLKLDALKQQTILLMDLGKMDEAILVAKQICERNDSEPTGYLLWAEILAEKRKFADAIPVLDQGLEKYPKHEKLMFSRGAYFERSGNKHAAEQAMRALIEVNPKHAGALNYLGYMFADDNRNLEEAESLVKRALELAPKNGGYQDSLGWIYYRKKQYPKALEVLEGAAKLDPEEGLIFEHIGDTHMALGETAKAKLQYELALKRKLDKADQERIQKKFDDLK